MYDYSQPGAYFVTICTHRRECLFENDEFRATAEAVWQATTSSYAGTTDDFVVMPNHLHGIVWIVERDVVGARQRLQPIGPGHHANDPQCSRDMSSLLRPNGPSSGSLGTIIGSFKTATAKRINNIRQTPGAAVWQRNYYEHIIRHEDGLRRIRKYILDNPRGWADDPENPMNMNHSHGDLCCAEM